MEKETIKKAITKTTILASETVLAIMAIITGNTSLAMVGLLPELTRNLADILVESSNFDKKTEKDLLKAIESVLSEMYKEMKQSSCREAVSQLENYIVPTLQNIKYENLDLTKLITELDKSLKKADKENILFLCKSDMLLINNTFMKKLQDKLACMSNSTSFKIVFNTIDNIFSLIDDATEKSSLAINKASDAEQIAKNTEDKVDSILLMQQCHSNTLKNFDRTNIPTHFMLPHGQKKIDSVFIDSCYKINEMTDLEDNLDFTTENTISTCISIINQQRIILIEGGFGSGKTILTKKIQQEYINQKKETMFLNANDIIGDLENNLFQEHLSKIIKLLADPIYIFIDGLDELNISIPNKKNAISTLINILINLIIDNNHCHFILNSRPYLKVTENDERIAMELSYLYSDMLGSQTIKYINTLGFNKDEIDIWLDKFMSDNLELSSRELKEWHKKALESCKIPLFLFTIATYFNDKNCLPSDIYQVYDYYIEKTINGKFNNKNKVLPPALRPKYKSLLMILSKDMLSYSSHLIDFQDLESENTDNKEILPLTKTNFCIKLNYLRNTTREYFNQFMQEIEAEEQCEQLDANILNCYFFKVFSFNDNTYVCFTDNNILSFLAAEFVYLELNKDSIINVDSIENCVKKIGDFRLHPLSVDFLISKLNAFNNNKKSKLVHLLQDYFGHCDKSDNFNKEIVQAQLLLQIIFIKLNDASYKALGLNHFFKKFDKLCKTVKLLELNGRHIEGKHRYLAERYFMNCKFYECCFRRINLKFFNFQDTAVKATEFEQCKFCDNNFLRCQMSESKFNLCSFSDVEINIGDMNEIEFKNSRMNNITITQPDMANNLCVITFNGCSIENFIINNLKSKNQKIIFQKCSIKDLKITQSELAIIVKDCTLDSQIKVTGSTFYTKDHENLLLFSKPNMWNQHNSEQKKLDETN